MSDVASPGHTPDLTSEEMLEILKAIARDGGNAAARIAAIRQLRVMQGDERPTSEGFEALDELAPRRRRAS